jgi:hypothetical protein
VIYAPKKIACGVRVSRSPPERKGKVAKKYRGDGLEIAVKPPPENLGVAWVVLGD